RRLERHRALFHGVDEAELGRVQHRSGGGEPIADVVADVDALAHDRVTSFGEVNADLVGAPRLETARYQCRSWERTDRLDMGDRQLSFLAETRGAAQVVAAVFHQVASERLLLDPSMRESKVAAVHRPRTELTGEGLLRRERSREHDDAARVLV